MHALQKIDFGKFMRFKLSKKGSKQEAHGPHHSSEKQFLSLNTLAQDMICNNVD